MSLQGGRDVLQPLDRQLVSFAQQLPVVLLMDAAMSSPGARETIVAIGSETTLLAHEAERGDAREPRKPLRRIWRQVQLAFLGTDDHLSPLRTVFNQSRRCSTVRSRS
jgi:hypothetical protein